MSSAGVAAGCRTRWTARRAGAPGVPGVPATVLALVAALACVVALLVRTGALMVHACLPGDGVVGALGVRLAVLGPDGDCPEGTLGLVGDGAGAARLVVLVALPVLLAYVAAALAGVGAVVVVRAARRALVAWVASLASLRPRLPGAPGVVVGPRPAAGVPEGVDVLVHQVLGALVRRRGPPVLATV